MVILTWFFSMKVVYIWEKMPIGNDASVPENQDKKCNVYLLPLPFTFPLVLRQRVTDFL